MSPAHSSILRTLAYADIFNYPLTLKEIHRWLINSPKSTLPTKIRNLQQTLQDLPQVQKSGLYYHFKNGPHLIKLRRQHAQYSQKKLKIAQKTTQFLKIIPTIKAILVTGTLAIKNSKKEDDIDLLIICQKNSLWLTRPLLILTLELLRTRRRPRDRGVANKICLNLFLDETILTLPQKDRNLFTAHELLQAQPLFSRGDAYAKFITQNSWAKKYLPHAYKLTINNQQLTTDNQPSTTINFLLHPFNLLFYLLQLLYMFPRRTKEKTSLHYAYFHPRSQKNQILKEYQKRLTDLGLKP